MLRSLLWCVGLSWVVVSCSGSARQFGEEIGHGGGAGSAGKISGNPSGGRAGGSARGGAASAGAAPSASGGSNTSGPADGGTAGAGENTGGVDAGGSVGASGSGGTSASAGAGGGGAGDPGMSCNTDMKPCAGKCVSLTDPAYGCGNTSCDPSGCPNPGLGGVLACSAGSCKIASCGTSSKPCGDKCVSLTDPTYGCGKTSCDATACPAAGTGTLVCQGEACVIGACAGDTKKCGNKCVPNDRNNGCANAASCTACANNEACAGSPSACTCVPIAKATACSGKCGTVANGCGGSHDCGGCALPQTCNGAGAPNVCGCTPMSMAAACSGKGCGTVANGCGGTYTCGTCTALPNAVATCQANTCVNSCAAGIMPLTCPNIPPDMPRCGVWSFETNTTEGWGVGDPSDPAITGKTTMAVGTAKKVDGSRALVVTTTIPGGENPVTSDYEQMITFEARLCPDLSSVNLSNRVFEVHAFFERISGTPLTSANTTINAGSAQQTPGQNGGSVGSSPFTVAEGVWLSGTAQVSVAANYLTISVSVGPRLPIPWNGRIYFDLLALH